jgi:hypothetical protein
MGHDRWRAAWRLQISQPCPPSRGLALVNRRGGPTPIGTLIIEPIAVEGSLAGRIAIQVGLCGRQARHRGPHQDGGAGARAIDDHLQLHQPRLCLDSFGREADSGNDEGTQHERGSDDQGRPARSPTYQGICHRRTGSFARVFLCRYSCGVTPMDWLNAPTKAPFRSHGTVKHVETTMHPAKFSAKPQERN